MANLKTGVSRKQKMPNFPKNKRVEVACGILIGVA